ncbi:MAG TPA: PAS domain-containing protein, partial [Myxococcales bacterium]|nr:PAS domain-containing protein [Myxococcales bacterium]
RVFLGLLAVMVLAVGLSGIAHINGLETEVDLSNPVNIIGKTGTVALIIVVFLFGMRGTTGLVAEQRELAKRKSREVERALEELRHFIQSANAPIFGVDKEGRVNEWNAMAAKITGYTREEALGSHLVNTYIADEHKQPVADVLERALAGANTANYELPLYSKSGERIEILLNATTRRNSDGSIVGVLGVGQDITDLREQERRLRQAHRVESVGHLAGGIAHDFNNLLAVIRGNVGIAISSLDGSEEQSFLQECLGDVATASADATKLTRQLLSASSQQAFLQETVNLGSLVSDSLGRSSPRKSDSRVISVDIDEPDLAVVVDSAQLESAIVNLIENAKDSTESEGRISVKVSIEQLTGDLNSEYSLQAGEYIVITVSDDGCGIEENVLPKVTDPFFSTKEVGEGAGLGLSVVNGFGKKNGWRTSAAERAGHGNESRYGSSAHSRPG